MGDERSNNRPTEELLSANTLKYWVGVMPMVVDELRTSIRNIGGKVMRKLTTAIPSDT